MNLSQKRSYSTQWKLIALFHKVVDQLKFKCKGDYRLQNMVGNRFQDSLKYDNSARIVWRTTQIPSEAWQI